MNEPKFYAITWKTNEYFFLSLNIYSSEEEAEDEAKEEWENIENEEERNQMKYTIHELTLRNNN